MDALANHICPSNFNLCSSDTDLVLSYLITTLIENWFGLLTDQVKFAKLHCKEKQEFCPFQRSIALVNTKSNQIFNKLMLTYNFMGKNLQYVKSADYKF